LGRKTKNASLAYKSHVQTLTQRSSDKNTGRVFQN